MSRVKQEREAVVLPYTITPIGDKDALSSWKLKRQELDKVNVIKQKKVRDYVVQLVANQTAQEEITPEKQRQIDNLVHLSLIQQQSQRRDWNHPTFEKALQEYVPQKVSPLKRLKDIIFKAFFPK